MNRFLLATSIIALAASPTVAQEEEEDYIFGEVTFSLLQTDSDTISSKFMEYRDLSEGPRASSARIYGKTGDFRYDLVGKNIGLDDQRYRLNLENKSVRLDGDYYRVPHNFGNGGKLLLNQTGPGSFELSDNLQLLHQQGLEQADSVNFDFLNGLLEPSLATAALVDIKLSRERGNLVFAITPQNKPFEIQATYFRERRTGTRAAAGTSFGFFNVVETPEALHYLTQDFGLRAELDGSWGVVSAQVRYNTFANRIDTQQWDNPFRAIDSTGGRAYIAPSAFSIDGPSYGLMSLPPDNEALTGTVGATFKLGDRTRLSADVSIGDWKQNETPFIAYTTNTSILTPGGQPASSAALPLSTLDGKIKTTAINAFFTTRLTDDLRINARYRRYDLNNDTPRVRFEEGYVRFDAVWEEIPRISVPNDYATHRFEALAALDVGDVTLEGGYRYRKTKRTFREAEETTDNGFLAKLDYHGANWLSLRASYEFVKRDHDEAHYDIAHSEHQSYIDAGAATNQPILRRFDTAQRDQNRYGAQVQIAPASGKVILVASYHKSKDDYDQTPVLNPLTGQAEAPLGLIAADYDTFSAELNFIPTERADFYVLYSREQFDDSQKGRQSGGTVSTNPADDWFSNQTTDVDSFGLGGVFVLAPDKWNLDVWVRYQKADGLNAFSTPPDGRATEDISAFDDTELATISAKLSYEVSDNWRLSLGAFYEDYEIEDAQTTGTLNYMPGSLFLAANNGDYKAVVGFAQLTYRW